MDMIISLILMLLGMIPGAPAAIEFVVCGSLRLVQLVIEFGPQQVMLILVSLIGLAAWYRLATEDLEPESKPVVCQHVSLAVSIRVMDAVCESVILAALTGATVSVHQVEILVASPSVIGVVATGGQWRVVVAREATVDTAVRVDGFRSPAPTSAPGLGVTGPPPNPRPGRLRTRRRCSMGRCPPPTATDYQHFPVCRGSPPAPSIFVRLC